MAASGGVLSGRTRLSGFASVLAAGVRARLRSLAAARYSVGARLLIAVVLFSGAVTLIMTAIQVYNDYRRDISAIDYRLTQIGDSYLDSLAEALWTRNEQQLQLKLQQILMRPDIGAVEVREAGTADDRFVVRLSGESGSFAIAREYTLRYKGQGQDRVIGTLRVEATYADVYRRLVGNALTILAAQATQTFLVCLFVLYIFRYLVTRHLSAIAADLGSHRIGDSPLQLRLRRSPPRREDELERLITAFNTLSYNLHIAYRDLHEREARIQRLVDANIIGIFIWDFDGRILEANDEFLRVVGYDREDLAAGRIRWTDLTPPEWLERDIQRWIPTHKMTGRLPPIEKEYFRKDGSRVPVLVGMTGFDETGNNGVAFVLDISEHKRAERALRDSEELKRRIIESSKDCIKVLDLDGNLLFMSSGGQQLLEIDDIQPYLNSAWIDFWPPEDRPKIGEAIAAARAGGVGQFQAFCPSAKGAPRWWDVITTPICNADGQPEQLVSVSRDITERKRAEAEARETEQRYRDVQMELAHANRVATIGQLTASIAHEVKQPIGATVANAQAALRFLSAQVLDLDELRDILTDIVKDGNRAGDIINRIRDLIKKAQAGKELLNINEAIREVIELARGETMMNGISVQTDLAEGIQLLEGDRVQLQQVILNLVVNAVEAMNATSEGARELLISTRKTEPDVVLVAVRDSGPGLAPAALDHLFDAFYTTKPDGLGLGLSICRSIIETHGGRLSAKANVPRGAIFEFSLPTCPDVANQPVVVSAT